MLIFNVNERLQTTKLLVTLSFAAVFSTGDLAAKAPAQLQACSMLGALESDVSPSAKALWLAELKQTSLIVRRDSIPRKHSGLTTTCMFDGMPDSGLENVRILEFLISALRKVADGTT